MRKSRVNLLVRRNKSFVSRSRCTCDYNGLTRTTLEPHVQVQQTFHSPTARTKFVGSIFPPSSTFKMVRSSVCQ